MNKTAPIPDVRISFCTDRKSANALAKFFARNVETSYISHSEMQFGRAVSANRWSPRLLAILTAEFRGLARSGGRVKDSHRLVQALCNGSVAGVAVVEFNNESIRPFAVLEDLVVDKRIRGAGIGGRMLAWIETEARRRRISELYLESGIRNGRAHEFFEKQKFAIVSKVMLKKLKK